MGKIDWPTSLFLIITPILAISLAPLHIYFTDVPIATFLLAFVFWLFTGMGITAGYHRMFSHKAYRSKPWYEVFVLFFGAAAWQGTALEWCTDHRRHHKKVDHNEDPYSIKKGFFFAHMGWLLKRRAHDDWPKDLYDNPRIRFQHKYYYGIAIFSCFGLPLLIGLTYGDPLGALLWAGVVRLVVVHHSTFFINSLAHMWGKQTYSDKNSSRDNPVLALFTYGEGYHNYHHMFEADYRNGIKWYDYDPTKWLIQGLNAFGQADRLRQTPKELILKHKMLMAEKRSARELAEPSPWALRLEELHIKALGAQKRIAQLKREYKEAKLEFGKKRQEYLRSLKAEIKLAKIELRESLNQWRVCLRQLEALPA